MIGFVFRFICFIGFRVECCECDGWFFCMLGVVLWFVMIVFEWLFVMFYFFLGLMRRFPLYTCEIICIW